MNEQPAPLPPTILKLKAHAAGGPEKGRNSKLQFAGSRNSLPAPPIGILNLTTEGDTTEDQASQQED